MNKTTARIKFYKKRQHYLLVVVKKVNNNNKTQREKFEMFFFMRISFASKKICMHVFYYCILNILHKYIFFSMYRCRISLAK